MGLLAEVERFTHLTRALDPKLRSNRFVIGLSAAAAVAGWATGGGAGGALQGALAAFLTWALGRELDPDRPWTAGAAATAAAVLTLLWPVAPGATLVLLMASRLLLRSTGLAPTRLDLVGVVALAAVFADSAAGWAAGVALAFAILRDEALSPLPRRRARVALAVAAALLVTWVAWPKAFVGWTAALDLPRGLLAVAGLAAGATLPSETPLSRGDRTPEPLDPARLRWTRRTALGALVLGAVLGGGAAVQGLAAGWLVLVATWIGVRVGGARTPTA